MPSREGRHHPVDRVLSTVATAGGQKDHSLCRILRRPLAHASHTFSPGWGKVLCRDLQALPMRVTPRGSIRESKRLFDLQVGVSVPGPDDPSTPTGSAGVVVARAVCLARAYDDRSASTASTTETGGDVTDDCV